MTYDPERYNKAKRKVEKIKKFYKHLSTWLVTSVFLFVLFLFLRIPPMVTLIVIGGWGLAIIGEAIDVFGFPGMDKDWEEKKIREELRKMERMERKNTQNEYHDEEESPNDSLELKEYRKIPKEWKDTDFV